GSPLECTALPVPDFTTPLRREVISQASAGETTCTDSSALDGLTSSSPNWTVRIAAMVAGRTPPFARGRYARASSSGVTSNAPSAIAGTGASCPWMPRARAISITVGSPTVWAMRTVAELSDCSSACRTVTIPSYRSSELRGLQGCPPDSTVIGRASTPDAAVKNGGPSGAGKAARYTIGLKAEPGWRWAEVTRLNWLLR